MRHITITGSLGSGKSVVSSILKERLGFEVESIGSLLRKMAQDYGMSTNDFNKHMETHPEFDHELDDFVKNQGLSAVPKIFDSRLAWHFIPQSFKVYLYVKDEIAAARVYHDSERINEEYNDVEAAQLNISQRRSSEVHRFKMQYDVNLEDFFNYDLIVDTSYSTPIEIADIIIAAYKKESVSKREVWLSPYILNPTQGMKKDSLDKVISPSFDKIEDYVASPISVIACDDKFFIYDGHKRVLSSIMDHISLLPCELINVNGDDLLPIAQSARDYVKHNFNSEIYCDWNDFVKPFRER